MESVLQTIYDAILIGDAKAISTAVQNALDAGISPDRILTEAMVFAMDEVGHLFEQGEFFVPEMLISARAMKCGMDVLRPRLVQDGYKPIAKIAIGTVKGDLHDIGKNLVAMMLESASFEIVDLGTDVPPDKFVALAQAGHVDIIALSALLTTTMPNMQATIDALASAGLRDKVKIIIGGAPVTEAYAKQIGADGYSPDASRSVALVRSLVKA
jgi:5-methyltetrahydrofolate--homocysteine methyltransferase